MMEKNLEAANILINDFRDRWSEYPDLVEVFL